VWLCGGGGGGGGGGRRTGERGGGGGGEGSRKQEADVRQAVDADCQHAARSRHE